MSLLKVYNPNIDPNLMIKIAESLHTDKDVENFEILGMHVIWLCLTSCLINLKLIISFLLKARRIIQPYPNTYCFTKSLAEQIVRKYAKNLNTAIIRPSIITVTYLDPIQGYTDNVYGLNGVLVGAGVGVLRIFRINNKFKSNIVPADYVINLILAISFYTATHEKYIILNVKIAQIFHVILLHLQ